MKYLQLIIFSSLMFTACAVPAPTAVAQDNDFTLGKVQSQLKEGMSSSQVVSLLGSPNLVTSTKDGGALCFLLSQNRLGLFHSFPDEP